MMRCLGRTTSRDTGGKRSHSMPLSFLKYINVLEGTALVLALSWKPRQKRLFSTSFTDLVESQELWYSVEKGTIGR